MIVSNALPRAVAAGIQDTCVNYYAFFVVAGILWVGTGRYKRLVNLRLLSFFGFISYGLYLIHFLSIELYNDVVAELAPDLLVEHSFRKGCLRLLIAGAFATGVAYLSRIWTSMPRKWKPSTPAKCRFARTTPSQFFNR